MSGHYCMLTWQACHAQLELPSLHLHRHRARAFGAPGFGAPESWSAMLRHTLGRRHSNKCSLAQRSTAQQSTPQQRQGTAQHSKATAKAQQSRHSSFKVTTALSITSLPANMAKTILDLIKVTTNHRKKYTVPGAVATHLWGFGSSQGPASQRWWHL